MSSAVCFNMDQSKILSSGNGLRKNCVEPYPSTGGTQQMLENASGRRDMTKNNVESSVTVPYSTFLPLFRVDS